MSSSGKSMSVLILGATGPLGIHTVKEALSHGFKVTVFVRSPHKLPEQIKNDKNTTTVVGQLSDTDRLFPLLGDFSAVISVLGPSGLDYKGTPLATFYTALLQHLRSLPAKNVPYLLVLATPSLYAPQDSSSWVRWLLIFLLRIMSHGAYSEIIAIGDAFEKLGKGLPWTLYRVGFLTDEVGKGLAKAGWVGGAGGWGSGFKIAAARVDIAKWLVRELETEEGERKWVGKMPTLLSE